MHACQDLDRAGPPLENLACQQTEKKWCAVSLNPWATLLLADTPFFNMSCGEIDFHNMCKTQKKKLIKMSVQNGHNITSKCVLLEHMERLFFKLMPINKFHLL